MMKLALAGCFENPAEKTLIHSMYTVVFGTSVIGMTASCR